MFVLIEWCIFSICFVGTLSEIKCYHQKVFLISFYFSECTIMNYRKNEDAFKPFTNWFLIRKLVLIYYILPSHIVCILENIPDQCSNQEWDVHYAEVLCTYVTTYSWFCGNWKPKPNILRYITEAGLANNVVVGRTRLLLPICIWFIYSLLIR